MTPNILTGQKLLFTAKPCPLSVIKRSVQAYPDTMTLRFSRAEWVLQLPLEGRCRRRAKNWTLITAETVAGHEKSYANFE